MMITNPMITRVRTCALWTITQSYIDAEDPDNGIEAEYHPKKDRWVKRAASISITMFKSSHSSCFTSISSLFPPPSLPLYLPFSLPLFLPPSVHFSTSLYTSLHLFSITFYTSFTTTFCTSLLHLLIFFIQTIFPSSFSDVTLFP